MKTLTLTLFMTLVAVDAFAVTDLKKKYGYVVLEPEDGSRAVAEEVIATPGAVITRVPIRPDGGCSDLPKFKLYPGETGKRTIAEMGTLKQTGPTDNPPCALVIPSRKEQHQGRRALRQEGPGIPGLEGMSDSTGRGLPPGVTIEPQSSIQPESPSAIDPTSSCIAFRELKLRS